MGRKDFQQGQLTCSFCGKSQREVRKLIAGPTVYICDECIRLCTDIIDEEAERETHAQEPGVLPTPRELVAMLDAYVVGQARTKRVLAVAVYNHYKRIHRRGAGTVPAAAAPAAGGEAAPEPAERAAAGVQAVGAVKREPGAQAEASALPRAAGAEAALAARPEPPAKGAPRPKPEPSDPVELHKSNVLLVGPTGTGKTLLAQTLARLINVPFTIADATTLTEAGYVGEDVENIIANLLVAADNDVERAQRGIIYIDEIDKIARKGESPSMTRDVSGEGVQQALLKIIEGTRANVPPRGAKKYGQAEIVPIDTSNILVICGGSFTGIEQTILRRIGRQGLGFGAQIQRTHERNIGELLAQIEPEDLTKYGLIPEFVGRLPVVATLDDLKERDLVRIMTEPKNALIRQYQKLFSLERVELAFDEEAVRLVARQAILNRSGARGLRAILEDVMLEIMYEVPFLEGIKKCTIGARTITDRAPPELVFEAKKSA